MALRLYTKEEFQKELSDSLKLSPTDETVGGARAWATNTGKHVLVPENGINVPELGERFPDNWMAEIYTQVEKLEN